MNLRDKISITGYTKRRAVEQMLEGPGLGRKLQRNGRTGLTLLLPILRLEPGGPRRAVTD